MSLFRPRQPRHFHLEYRYARPKRLISDRLDNQLSERRPSMLMNVLMLILLIAVLLIVWKILTV